MGLVQTSCLSRRPTRQKLRRHEARLLADDLHFGARKPFYDLATTVLLSGHADR
jgi:hypothetical protein